MGAHDQEKSRTSPDDWNASVDDVITERIETQPALPGHRFHIRKCSRQLPGDGPVHLTVTYEVVDKTDGELLAATRSNDGARIVRDALEQLRDKLTLELNRERTDALEGAE